MPYKTFPVKGGFKNWKVDEMGKKVGEPLSKKPLTEEDADSQRKALYAAENKEASTTYTDTIEVEYKEAGDDETKMWGEEVVWLPPGVTSFAELDAYIESQEIAKDMRGDVEHFKDIASNIMMSDLVEDKAAALAALASEFSGRIGQQNKECDDCDDREDELKAVWSTAFVNNLPDGSFLYVEKGTNCSKDGEGKTKPRSCRHFPYKDASGKIDLPHLRNAVARIPQSNAPGLNKASLQERARRLLQNAQKELSEETWFDKLVNRVKEAIKPQAQPKTDDIYIWKENGQYRCLLAYTNNFRDEDNPPEIISAQSHKEFDDALNKGEWPMPRLWLWHVPYPVGQVVTHAYDEKSGFSLAGAVFDKDKSWAAEAIMNRPWSALSHGMPKVEIQRDSNDKSIITRHRTREISFLPGWAAANKRSFYLVSKENSMEDKEIPAHKLEEFEETFGQERVKKMQDEMSQASQRAKEDGAESKEQTPEQPEAEATVNLQSDDVVEAIRALTTAVAQVTAQVKGFDDRLKELEQTDAAKIAKATSAIPEASLASYVKSNLFSEANRVEDKGKGPKETENKQDGSSGLFWEELGWTEPVGVR